ncbi:hypothetical protein TWF281_005530 [Arthrobotrys megalospora]
MFPSSRSTAGGESSNATRAFPPAQKRRLDIRDYTAGWVCALPIEYAAAITMLDEEHQDLPRSTNHTNLYTLGRIYKHNVVIVCLPAGRTGLTSATAAAKEMMSKFPKIQFGLLVGVGGGVPTAGADIRLGDVVISQPHGQHGGVIQYDSGKEEVGGFLRTGSLNAPPTVLLNAVSGLRKNHLLGRTTIFDNLAVLMQLPAFAPKGPENDTLFRPDSEHIEGQGCEKCSKDGIVKRDPRPSQNVVIHYGTIASANTVVKNGQKRD